MINQDEVHLSNPNVDPSDNALSLIMKDVSLVANLKAKKAEDDFFQQMSKSIANKYSSGTR